MIVTKSLDTMIANEEASAFTDTKVNSDELIKSNSFDSSEETSESINKDVVSNDTSIISTEKEATPLKKLDVAVENVSKNGEKILPKEKNEDNIKNGGDESLGKKSEDEKIATKNSVVETEKEPSEQNSVEEKTEKEKTTSTTKNESKEEENNDNNKEKIQNEKKSGKTQNIDASKDDNVQPMEEGIKEKTEDSKMDVDNVEKEPMKDLQNAEAKNSEKDVKKITDHTPNNPEEKNNSEKKGAISLEPATQSDSESQGTADSSEAEDESKKEEKKSEETVKDNAPPSSEKLPMPPVVDYNKGLEELTNIANCGKNINEEDGQKKITNGLGHKRSSSVSEEGTEPAKKPKIDENIKVEQDIKVEFNNSIKKTLKKLSREQLEDMVTNKIAESISARSTIGDLRRKCDKHEEDVEKWKRKTQMLQKMCSDLNTVMKRYILDVQNKQDNPTPIKITRSVGLQVVTDRARKQQTPTAQNQTSISRQTTPTVMRSPPPLQSTKNNLVKTPQSLISRSPSATLTPSPSNVVSKSNNILVTPPKVSFTPIAPRPTTTGIVSQNVTGLVSQNMIPPKPENMVKINTSSPSRLQSLPTSVSVIQTQSSATPTTSTTTSTNGAKQVIDIVDLSDEEDDKPKQQQAKPNNGIRMVPTANLVSVNRGTTVLQTPVAILQSKKPTLQMTPVMKHPAPLPDPPKFQISGQNMKSTPPKPTLKISRLTEGIILSWNMNLNLTIHASIASYQIYAYQERAAQPVVSTLWKKVGDVKALDLPMACTLTQFSKGNKYHFAVRARDCHSRVGNFSDPLSISLT